MLLIGLIAMAVGALLVVALLYYVALRARKPTRQAGVLTQPSRQTYADEIIAPSCTTDLSRTASEDETSPRKAVVGAHRAASPALLLVDVEMEVEITEEEPEAPPPYPYAAANGASASGENASVQPKAKRAAKHAHFLTPSKVAIADDAAAQSASAEQVCEDDGSEEDAAVRNAGTSQTGTFFVTPSKVEMADEAATPWSVNAVVVSQDGSGEVRSVQ
jgi:hypothetical protein